jgi:hypothetical protein
MCNSYLYIISLRQVYHVKALSAPLQLCKASLGLPLQYYQNQHQTPPPPTKNKSSVHWHPRRLLRSRELPVSMRGIWPPSSHRWMFATPHSFGRELGCPQVRLSSGNISDCQYRQLHAPLLQEPHVVGKYLLPSCYLNTLLMCTTNCHTSPSYQLSTCT